MEIVVHYPETEEGKRMLQERVTELHAQLIINCIDKLSWDKDKKMRLFNEVKKEIKRRANNEQILLDKNYYVE
ncbi:hypothetical protein [Brassicibacter mesophilus]|uniref:hypothetical protein n=1 Tax=Brassicibacter mesophilus TaxID=745119 RepID=UPI003D1DD68E